MTESYLGVGSEKEEVGSYHYSNYKWEIRNQFPTAPCENKYIYVTSLAYVPDQRIWERIY